jgi:hypothetical protein
LKSEENIWFRFECIIELAQWMYSNEYELSNCLGLCEWASLMVMFGVKQNKPLTTPIESSSRSVSIVSQSGVKQSRASGKKGAGGKAAHSILPTIEDNAEPKKVHDDLVKNATAEFEKIKKNSNSKYSMFGK